MKSGIFGKFFIFIGLLLAGVSCYMEFIGDIPIVDTVFEKIGVGIESDVIGDPIKVEKINTIEYNELGGQDYEVHKEEIDGSVSKSFFVNVKLGNESYRLSFMYPENLSLLSGDDKSIVIGNDNTNITFTYTTDKYEDYYNYYSTDIPSEGFYVRNFSITNDVSKVHIFNIAEGDDELFINKASILIYDLNEEGKGLLMDIRTKNRKIPDSLLINIYNSFVFEKTDYDFEFCKNEDNKYNCNFKLNNYNNSNRKKVHLEFDSDLYKIDNYENDNSFLSSNFRFVRKDDNSKKAEVTFKIVYSEYLSKMIEYEKDEYVEERINGRNYIVRNYDNDPNAKSLIYEIEPNLYIKIYIETSDGLFDQTLKTFTNFKVK